MPEWLAALFSSGDFMPHGHCYQWNRGLVWLHVVSDALIALAYTSIPFTLAAFVRKRKDIPFNWMFVCFGVFIIACGATHVMEIWTLWTPTYWLAGVVKAITAAASVPTAILLIWLLPKALAIPTPNQWRQAHQELMEANAALQATVAQRVAEAEALRRAKAAAEAANAELEAFSYSVAHDLRAPLRAINGFSSALLEDWGARFDEPATKDLNRIIGAADRMGELIDALLALARLTRTEPRRESIDLSLIAGQVVAELQAADPKREVDWSIAEGMLELGDPQLLQVVLENLLGNAWKFTGKRSCARIEFGVSSHQGAKVYFVKDNGAGFDMNHVQKLFAPFRRLHTSQQFEGTGIGLATVQRIVRRHGGKVWAESVENEGATFYFTLSLEGEQGSSN
jgi:signal transduction histidine kinase